MKEKLPGYMGGGTIKKGGLHKSLGIPAGKKIPVAKIEKAEKKGGKVGKQAQLAENFSKMNHKHSNKPKKNVPTPFASDRGDFKMK